MKNKKGNAKIFFLIVIVVILGVLVYLGLSRPASIINPNVQTSTMLIATAPQYYTYQQTFSGMDTQCGDFSNTFSTTLNPSDYLNNIPSDIQQNIDYPITSVSISPNIIGNNVAGQGSACSSPSTNYYTQNITGSCQINNGALRCHINALFIGTNGWYVWIGQGVTSGQITVQIPRTSYNSNQPIQNSSSGMTTGANNTYSPGPTGNSSSSNFWYNLPLIGNIIHWFAINIFGVSQ